MKILNNLKIKINAMVNSVSVALMTCPAFCLPDENTDPEVIIMSIITLIITIARYIGVVFLAWGIYQFVMSFKDENAESKSRAMIFLGSAIALIGMKSLLKVAGII